MRDYDAGLKEAKLIDRSYYRGICRHTTEATWGGVRQALLSGAYKIRF
jgi:hypothetical protein